MSSESGQPEGVAHLSDVFAGWDAYQRLLVEALAPLTPDQLALRAAPSLRSVGEIAGHIVATRVWWFQNWMGEGDDSLVPMLTWDDADNPPTLNAAELELGLERTWHMIASGLSRWTTADLGAEFERESKRHTRQWVIWHVIEHDLHHGGEIGITLGQHGLRAPDL
ncbi:MAG TPA: DinB family protein [Ktedonobacterales bacterium]|nr:DinB family protein [Ktedonobacterales bacterium]